MRTHTVFRGLMAFMLLMLAGQSLMAQEAFYVYRNDGDFNGFFYDQVKRMSLSKIDFDGVEHDDYVIEEIETDDSLYRIPILAIDSISFVQPEIIFNPRLKNLAGGVANHFSVSSRRGDGSGECMSDWVRKVENGYFNAFLYFDMDTPKELLPEVGDVLVDFYDQATYGYDYTEYKGFAGKVTHVFESHGYMLVRTDRPKELSDIFVQFITVEEVVDDGESEVRRRLAGWPEDEARKKAMGTGTASLVDINVPLKQDFEIGKGKIGVELGVGLKVKLGVSYNITAKNLFVKTIMTEDFTLKGSVTGKYDGDYDAEILGLPKPVKSIKFPATAPIFQTKPIPNAFLRVKGEMGAKLDLPTIGFRSKQVVVFDTDDTPMMSSSSEVTGPDGEPQKGILDGSDLTLYFNGSVQLGAKFSANIETNDWIDAVFHSGIYANFYVGPQIDGQIEMKANLADLATGNVPGIYSAMKESKINFAGLAANVELKGKLKLLKEEDDQTFLELNRKWMETSWYIFPKVSSNEVEFDPKTRLVNCKLTVKRPVFLIQYLGLGIYDAEGNCLDKQFSNMPYFLSEKTNNEMECSFNVPCGRYWVRPLLKVAGAEVEVDDPDAEREVIVTPLLYHETAQKTDIVEMGGEEEKIEIYFKTDAKEIELLEGSGYNVRLREGLASVGDPFGENDRVLTVMPGKNPSIVPREWSIVLEASVGTFVTTDTILVKQASGHPDSLFLGITINCNQTGEHCLTGTDEYGTYDVKEEIHRNGIIKYGKARCSYIGNILTLTLESSSGFRPDGRIDTTMTVYNEENAKTVRWGCSYSTSKAEVTIDLDNMTVISGHYNYNRKWEDWVQGAGRFIYHDKYEGSWSTNKYDISTYIDKCSWGAVPRNTTRSGTWANYVQGAHSGNGYLLFVSEDMSDVICDRTQGNTYHDVHTNTREPFRSHNYEVIESFKVSADPIEGDYIEMVVANL